MEAEDFLPPELDVQKAVVESLAADKAEQDEKIVKLEKEKNQLVSKIAVLNEELRKAREELGKVGDLLAVNAEGDVSNKVALLDREMEIPDRFMGETRDHVLEVLKVARDQAEADGRLRLAQVLEGVLLANVPTGNLAKKREELEKLFSENQNILNGTVINELDKRGISYKNGEEYLLAAEILKRTY